MYQPYEPLLASLFSNGAVVLTCSTIETILRYGTLTAGQWILSPLLLLNHLLVEMFSWKLLMKTVVVMDESSVQS